MTSPASGPAWEQLAAPAKAAFRWAWAIATTRSAPAVDSFDLLAGIMLADLTDSPPRVLFDHFRIPPGEVLRRSDSDAPTSAAVLAAVARLPAAGGPPMDSPMLAGVERMPSEPDGLVSLRVLFGVLLESGLPASAALRRAVNARGIDPGTVIRSYRDYLGGRHPYAEFLRERIPYTPPRVELPAYVADQPHARAAVGETDEPEDLVGIGSEVDAFAHLIASKRLVPPLAVGLFGDWGSGKSYFLRSLQRRIDAIAADRRPTFHRSIVQIEFNAWQYVDGNLWASLIEHLFRNLRMSGDDSDDLLAKRQRYWVQQVQSASAEHQQALKEQKGLEDKHHAAEQEVADRKREREKALGALERVRREKPFAGWRPSDELRKQVHAALTRAGVQEVTDNARQLATALDEARSDLRGLAGVLAPLRSGGPRYVIAVIAALSVTPVVTFVLQSLDLSPVSTVAGGTAWLLSTVAGYVSTAGRFTRDVTARIVKAQEDLAAVERKRRQELDEQVLGAKHVLDKAQSALDTAMARERELAAKVAEAKETLDETTPSRVLTEFINERLDSEDYRRHLGVPALVRRDLERLSRLVAAQQLNPGTQPTLDHYAIDRIVLYIDDLDRCPTPLVIKVLEAVHLLLAFPLFVVVVAVDARWLTSSLAEHYQQLSGTGPEPEDYLEKIFQVPFWVRPLGSEVREQMLRGLLVPSLAGPTGALPEQDGDATIGVAETDMRAFRDVVASLSDIDGRARAWADAVALTISTEELTQIEDVADLLDATPRALKRFVNIYLLLKSMGTSRGWRLPGDGQLVVMLAITTGLPRLASGLLAALSQKDVSLPLGQLVPADQLAEHEPFRRWLDTRPERGALDMAGLADWAGLITRFRFTPL